MTETVRITTFCVFHKFLSLPCNITGFWPVECAAFTYEQRSSSTTSPSIRKDLILGL